MTNVRASVSSRLTIQPPKPVCGYCHDLIPPLQYGPKDKWEGGVFNIQYMDLLKSSAGCSRCKFILQIFHEYQPVAKEDEPKINAGFHFSSQGTKPDHIESVHDVVPGKSWMSMKKGEKWYVPGCEIYTLQDYLPQFPTIAHKNNVAATADSPECMSLARSWLRECLANHAKCNQHRLSEGPHLKPLPDRVLYIGTDREPYVFCNIEKAADKYAALSHCWGGNVRLQLKQENLKDFQTQIPLKDFPKTFRDAITVCRALDLQYIWIDSLCIIQDSHQDWEEQAGKMVHVYSNAHVTIAADAAENSEAGFLKGTREVTRSKVLLLSPEHQIFARPIPSESSKNGVVSHYYTKTVKSCLAERGWTFQETLLSPRTLHFTEGEMSWRCGSFLGCECQGLHPNNQAMRFYFNLQVDILGTTAGWHQVIGEHTRRHLTYPTDKLAALAGLAARAQASRPGMRYMSGLWENDLPFCLIWRVDKLRCKRIQPTIAPTWSWACLDGEVTTLTDKGKSDILQNIVINYPDMKSSPYGGVPAGQRASLTATANLYGYRVIKFEICQGISSYCKMILEIEERSSSLEPRPVDGMGQPDAKEELDWFKAGEQGVLMDVCGSNSFIMLRRIGECDSTFQRIGLWSQPNSEENIREVRKCEKKRITIF